MPAFVCVKEPRPLIAEGDGILFFNFRGDRARQLSQVVLHGDFKGFNRTYYPKVSYLMMTQYDATFNAPAMFPPQSMNHLLGQVVAAAGMHQLRMAETEKYPHVTYFFNGGVETPNPGEDREMVPSPKVATYDLQPEMSAVPLTDEVIKRLDTGTYDLLILNYANPDMVGHTGVAARPRSRRWRRSTRASSAWWKKSSPWAAGASSPPITGIASGKSTTTARRTRLTRRTWSNSSMPGRTPTRPCWKMASWPTSRRPCFTCLAFRSPKK